MPQKAKIAAALDETLSASNRIRENVAVQQDVAADNGRFPEMLVEQLTMVRRYARSLTRDASRAEDLVQDVAERALRKQHLWQAGTDLGAWLRTLTHNAYVNDVRRFRRQEGFEVPVDDLSAIVGPPVRPAQESRLLLKAMRMALLSLEDDQFRVIGLIARGLTYEQAAEIEGVPVGTIRSRLSRGREALRLVFEGSELSEEEREMVEQWRD